MPRVSFTQFVQSQVATSMSNSTDFSIETTPEVPGGQAAAFERLLAELTPRVWVTPTLIAVNVLLFVAMTVSGVSLLHPTIDDLLRWGADFGPYTMSGQWWRTLTCTFIHIGVLHVVLNMWVLSVAGPLVERMVGNLAFLVMYLIAGLCGSAASLWWNPMLVSAGASGAIFGVYGALLGLLLRHRGSIPAETLARLRSSGLGFLGYNLLFGMMLSNIDSAAHLGGLAGGFLGGLVLSQPFTPEARAGRLLRTAVLALLGALLVAGAMAGVAAQHAQVAAVQHELQGFQAMERQALQAFNGAVAKAQRQELSDAAFADLLERDVLPPWRTSRERLAAFRNLPAKLERHVGSVLEYMHLREDAWKDFATAMRENDGERAEQAKAKQLRADEAAKRIGH